MMRNKEVLNEIRKQSRTLIEEKRDKFVKQRSRQNLRC